jgi:predicted enzyme related to lactoylglutathione lyase
LTACWFAITSEVIAMGNKVGCMALNVEMVTFDSSDPAKLAGWWAEQFDGETQELIPGEFVAVIRPDGPRLGFQKVADPTPGKNRVHLDFGAADVDAEVSRLTAAGATEVGRHSIGDNFRWVVLTDPDGNAFCVAGSQ